MITISSSTMNSWYIHYYDLEIECIIKPAPSFADLTAFLPIIYLYQSTTIIPPLWQLLSSDPSSQWLMPSHFNMPLIHCWSVTHLKSNTDSHSDCPPVAPGKIKQSWSNYYVLIQQGHNQTS